MAQNERFACHCLNLRRAALALTKVYDNFLGSSGLKVSQYSLMKCINKLSPVNVSDLAAAMKLDRTTLVRNLKPLEEKGLISDAAPKNSRDRQLVLTDDGRKCFILASSLWQDAQNAVEDYIGREDLSILLNLLSKIEQMDK